MMMMVITKAKVTVLTTNLVVKSTYLMGFYIAYVPLCDFLEILVIEHSHTHTCMEHAITA